MGWKTFELTDITTQETNEYELPNSAPATIVQDAIEIMHGDTEGRLEGDNVKGSVKTVNIEKAAHHIAKETLKFDGFPRGDKEIQLKDLDGKSLDKLKNHYMEVDLTGKNSNQSGEEQNS